MKKITAMFRTWKEDDVKEALVQLSVGGVTSRDVVVPAENGDPDLQERKLVRYGTYVKKAQFEIFVDDDRVDEVMRMIQSAAHTGRIGDGHIHVSDIIGAVRVRTREIDGEAGFVESLKHRGFEEAQGKVL